jgi:hypothetical protein
MFKLKSVSFLYNIRYITVLRLNIHHLLLCIFLVFIVHGVITVTNLYSSLEVYSVEIYPIYPISHLIEILYISWAKVP